MPRRNTIAWHEERHRNDMKDLAELRRQRKELREDVKKAKEREEKAVKDLLRYKYDTDARIDRMKLTFADTILTLTEAAQ